MSDLRRNPDIFRKGDAAVYLHLADDPQSDEAAKAIENLRERNLLSGIRLGKEFMYTRRELDALIVLLESQVLGTKTRSTVANGKPATGPRLRLA